MGLTNPGRALGRLSLLSISRELSTLLPHSFPQTHFGWLSLLVWLVGLKPFLSDRRACVVYQNLQSRSFLVWGGVPQKSIVCPVLFSLFINDLPASLPSSVSCSLYADDLALGSDSGVGHARSSVSIGALV